MIDKREAISLDVALDFFYHSEVYLLMRVGVSAMHCMSDDYLAEKLIGETLFTNLIICLLATQVENSILAGRITGNSCG